MNTIRIPQHNAAASPQAEPELTGATNGATWLHTTPSGGRLSTADEAPREWLFPQGDELFRGIYTRAGSGFTAEVLAICSAVAGEGKTTVGLGLAVTIAEDFPDRRVLLVETDLQRPVLSEDFGFEASHGLLDCLIDGMPLLSACLPTFLDNLHVLPAGSAERVPGRPLRSTQMAAIVDAMRQSYDVVILDLPALLVNSDAILLTDLADGIVCVVRGGRTPVALVNRAMEQIDQAKVRGVVINGADSAIPGWLRRLAGI
jgi:capsular exopolysaccharide synthesis family protein